MAKFIAAVNEKWNAGLLSKANGETRGGNRDFADRRKNEAALRELVGARKMRAEGYEVDGSRECEEAWRLRVL